MPPMLSPKGYRVSITKDGATSPHLDVVRTNHREAERECIRESKALGLGTKGEVLGGPKLTSAIMQGIVVATNNGKLRFRKEET